MNISPGLQLALLGAAALVVLAIGVRLVMQLIHHRNPEKREQRRRLRLNADGRLGDAMITSADQCSIYYAYSVHGVQYEASQDISTLLDRLPAEPERLIGLANLKYATNNPANSIIVCEEWSGVREPNSTYSRAQQSAR